MTSPQASRRAFLKGALAAPAAPLILRSSAWGANDRIGMGFIGLGGRGSGILRSFVRQGVSEAIAVCDPWRDRAERMSQSLPSKPYPTADFREVVGRDDIDAVTIASPDHWHVLLSLAAFKNGKDVYCEKPLSVTIQEGRALADTARRYARVFQHGTHQRSYHGFRYVCELALNGYIGKVHTIRVCERGGHQCGNRAPMPVPPQLDHELWLGPAPWSPFMGQSVGGGGWQFRSDYTAGWISGCGVHPLDIAQWGNGTDRTGPLEIEGTGTFPTDGYNDTAIDWNVEFRYANGVKLIFTSTRRDVNSPEVGARFEGTEGWVMAHGNAASYLGQPESLLKIQLKGTDLRLCESRDHSGNFLDCVRTRRETVAPAEVAHRSTSLCLLADIALRLKRPLRWDPDKEQFPADPEANRHLSRAMREPWRL